ncbi:TetR/AcrR family transcriptional regulator [Nannocystis bainbridge]|uniref:TetR/AcrR family transcriptional regulator n=1 Tax=Nannocystis bainbridge TaxID=2995303 RepID=A0ABT5E583_9BACT|nr:TetR/AcrR family transcriptional regulator [Nannocystis bainbridge]MDC0719911.1 TetR/AcrR family transcriptional regulator [Nannocystis bainbridge]
MERAKKLRADGQRNRERIVAAAAELVARDGAQASLEEVAQRAGVGSATLHRHFSSRQALLEAVFRAGVAQLCERAAAQPGEDPGAELAAWLEEMTVYAATHRGLATALLAGPDGLSTEEVCCTDMLLGVLEVLVARASSAGALQAGATSRDLMVLANAVAVATENDPATTSRLLRLALTGIRTASSPGEVGSASPGCTGPRRSS